jgi:hypothetical protein
MTPKLFEIRDRGTCISALAIQVSGDDGYLMRRAGFQAPMVYLIMLATEQAHYDPYAWHNRTMGTAHRYITAAFTDLVDGQVVDVEYLLGETPAPKQPEARGHYLK